MAGAATGRGKALYPSARRSARKSLQGGERTAAAEKMPIGKYALFTSPMPAQDVDAGMINLPEPVAWFANYGGNVYTEAQLKQAVRDALDALKDVAQTLAWTQHGECRGFSDGLLTTDEALDKARDALSKYKGAKA